MKISAGMTIMGNNRYRSRTTLVWGFLSERMPIRLNLVARAPRKKLEVVG